MLRLSAGWVRKSAAADLLNDETVTDLDWESAVLWRQMLTDFRGGLLSQDAPPGSSASLLVPASRVQWLSGQAELGGFFERYNPLFFIPSDDFYSPRLYVGYNRLINKAQGIPEE